MHLITTWLRLGLLLSIAYLLLTLATVRWGVHAALIPPPATEVATFDLPRLGINVALAQANGQERQAALARLQRTGFGWVRQRIDWGQLEPTPNHYDWRQSDALLREIRAAGLIPVIVLDGSPAWARAPQDRAPTDNPLAPPADFQHFAHFAGAFAQRYHNQVRFYQIWDEPNIAPHWGNQLIEPVGYAQLLRVAATAIRAADADAVIISAALAPTRDRGHTAIDEPYFLQRLYAAGAAPDFDVVAIQPFGFGYAPTDRRARPDLLNFGRAQLIRRTMVAAGDESTPVWAVRYGWNRASGTPWATVSAADQARFAVEALTLAQQEWPWLTALGWATDQPVAPTGEPVWGFALTPTLAQAFGTWVADEAGSNRLKPVADRQNPLKRVNHTLLLWSEGIGWFLLMGMVLTRVWLVGWTLPWARWGARYRCWPWWGQASLWLGVGVIYYYATWPGLILLCWLVGIILLRWQPEAGLWLAAALLPFHAQHKEFALGALTFAVAPSHVVLLCLAVGYAFWGRARNDLHKRLPYGTSPERVLLPVLGLGWLLINLLSAGNVWQWPAYWEGFWDLTLLPLLGGWLVWRLITTRAAAIRLLTACFIGGGAVALIGLGMWWRGNGTMADGVLRLVGPYFSPNETALYLERTLFVGLGLFSGARGIWRGWLLGTLALISLALFLTASRGAWLLGISAGVLWLSWVHGWGKPHWRWRKGYWWLLGPLLLVGGSVGLWLSPDLLARLTNSATLSQRLLTWQATVAMWRDFPWFGVGPGGFFWRYPAYLPIGALDEPNLHHPHNLWLELASGWGLLGLIWLGLLLWWIGKQWWQSRCSTPFNRSAQVGLWAALLAGLAHAQVDAFLVLPDLALWLGMGLAVLGRIDSSQKKAAP